MTYRTTLGLLVALMAAGAILWVLDRHVAGTAQRQADSQRVVTGDLARVARLTIRVGTDDVALQRTSRGWRLSAPVDASARAGQVARLLGALEALKRREIITSKQRRNRGLGLEDYGLLSPRASLELTRPEGTEELLIGKDAPFGAYTYVKWAQSSDVIATDRSLIDALPTGVDALRDRRLLEGRASRVVRVELEQADAGFIQVQHSPQGWMLQQPVREAADAAVVAALLERLQAAEIQAFAWDAPVRAGAVSDAGVDMATLPDETYGLGVDMAPLRIRLWWHGEDTSRELVFGKTTEDGKGVYARLGPGTSVVVLPVELLTSCRLTPDAFRRRSLVLLPMTSVRWIALAADDRRLVLAWDDAAGWSVREPGQWPADTETVRAWLDALSNLRVATFFDPAAAGTVEAAEWQISLAAALPAADGGPATEPDGERVDLRVGGATTDDPYRKVQSSERAGLLGVSAAQFPVLGVDPLDPLFFMDRVVLAIEPEAVQRLVVKRPGTEQTVLLDDAPAGWHALQDDRVARKDVIADVLFRMANLRARRVVEHSPADLKAYGLDAAAASLTLGLRGSDGILKTLLFGATTARGERFAMVQGRDVVFALDLETVRALLQDLTRVREP